MSYRVPPEECRYELRKTLDDTGKLCNTLIARLPFFTEAFALLQPGEHIVDKAMPHKQWHWLANGIEFGWLYVQ